MAGAGTSELYDPGTRGWTSQPSGAPGSDNTAVLLHTGQVFTASGSNATRYTPASP